MDLQTPGIYFGEVGSGLSSLDSDVRDVLEARGYSPVGFLGSGVLFARFSDCEYAVRVSPFSDQELSFRERGVLHRVGDHSEFPSLFDAFTVSTDDGEQYVNVMEYFSAASVADLVRKGVGLNHSDAVDVLRGGLSSLATLHGEGLTHYGVSPDSVHYDGQRVQLSDFRYACVCGDVPDFPGAVSYYPSESYDRDLDSFVDVVALGNVVISGGYRKVIERVRSDQGISGLSPVLVDDLPFSDGLRSYLHSVVSTDRFSSAKDALSGLESALSPVVVSSSDLEERIDDSPSKRVKGVGSGVVGVVGAGVVGVVGAGAVVGGAVVVGLAGDLLGDVASLLVSEDSINKGALYGGIGGALSFVQGLGLYMHFGGDALGMIMGVGAGIGLLSVSVEPTRIIGGHHLRKWRENRLERKKEVSLLE